MHGIGNDYIYIDCFAQPAPEDPSALAEEMSRAHFGIGADGLVLILPSDVADCRMRMFNKDGSEGNMCGNAVRCVGKYMLENLCRVPVEPMLASEFRYCDPLCDENTLVLIISQSGETADTLAALREAKRRGARTLAIVNVAVVFSARTSCCCYSCKC